MKKMSVFFVLLLALCIVLPASAQVHLGVLGGLNLANLSVDPDEGVDFSSRTAFGFGGVLDYDLGEYIALHLEPMYLQKGTETTEDGVDVEFKLAYLELPLLFKYTFGTSDTKPYVMAGPTIGFNLSAKVKGSEGGVSAEIDIKDETKSIDFGLGFGAGVSLPMGNNSIFVEARYALGLTNIFDDPADPDTDVKTKGIQIFAGITFPLGGDSYRYKGQ